MLFITIVYFLVNTTVSFEQRLQLQSTADQQADGIRSALKDRLLSPEELENITGNQENSNQFFYYVVSPNGQLLVGEEAIHPLRPDLLHLVQGWVPEMNEIRFGTVIAHPHGRHHGDEKHPIDLMMTGRAIYQGDKVVAVFYIGKDISFYDQLVHQLLVTLVTLGILFLGIAFLLSYFMSKRAMVPIRTSFNRQREFVADASHELRTPLSILHSSLDVLEMEEGDYMSEFSRNVLFTMKDEVRRMTNLVGDLLTLARSDSGVPDLRYESFDLIPSAEQLVRSTQTLADSKNIRLHLHTPTAITVHGDHERLKQLLYILLDNAIKYTPNGGEVTLTLSEQTYDKQPALCIAVQDTGVGIPLGEQKHIFDRFYRVDKNRSRQMGGTGLGLAIAKWIVEAHHGTIQVSSTPGQGSTFTVLIPIVQQKT